MACKKGFETCGQELAPPTGVPAGAAGQPRCPHCQTYMAAANVCRNPFCRSQRPLVVSNKNQPGAALAIRFVSPGLATAQTADGWTYRTTTATCNCPDFRHHRQYTGEPCRHIQAVRFAAKRAGVAGFDAPLPTPDPAQGQALLERRRQTREAWRLKEQARRQSETRAAQKLSDREFAEIINTPSPPPYRYDNVLGGSRATFGVEIEVEGPEGDWQFGDRLAKRLHAEGLAGSPKQGGYKEGVRSPGLFAVELDPSLGAPGMEGLGGAEIVSPVLTDSPEDWRKLERVCQILEEEGAKVTTKCGMHCHIGSAPLDSQTNLYHKMVGLWTGFEDVMFRLSAEGQHRGAANHYKYSAPLDDSELNPHFESVDRVKFFGEGKRGALNFKNAGSGDNNTVEFRTFNGTLDPTRLQANVMLAAAFVDTARLDPPDEAIPAPERLGSNQGQVGHGHFRQFLDAFFAGRQEDQASIAAIFKQGQWQAKPLTA